MELAIAFCCRRAIARFLRQHKLKLLEYVVISEIFDTIGLLPTSRFQDYQFESQVSHHNELIRLQISEKYFDC